MISHQYRDEHRNRRSEMTRHQLFDETRDRRVGRSMRVRKLRAIGLSVTTALALAGALAPLAQAGVDAQHNETLVVV
jgi:hypothetical protein